MYQYDFSKITLAEWVAYGYYLAIFPNQAILWLGDKAAEFDFASVVLTDALVLEEYQRQIQLFFQGVPDSTNLTPEEITNIFWRAVRGE